MKNKQTVRISASNISISDTSIIHTIKHSSNVQNYVALYPNSTQQDSLLSSYQIDQQQKELIFYDENSDFSSSDIQEYYQVTSRSQMANGYDLVAKYNNKVIGGVRLFIYKFNAPYGDPDTGILVSTFADFCFEDHTTGLISEITLDLEEKKEDDIRPIILSIISNAIKLKCKYLFQISTEATLDSYLTAYQDNNINVEVRKSVANLSILKLDLSHLTTYCHLK